MVCSVKVLAARVPVCACLRVGVQGPGWPASVVCVCSVLLSRRAERALNQRCKQHANAGKYVHDITLKSRCVKSLRRVISL